MDGERILKALYETYARQEGISIKVTITKRGDSNANDANRSMERDEK